MTSTDTLPAGSDIDPITSTDELAAFCAALAAEPFITIDTEFIRETTYWPKLCLIQLAGKERAEAIDPLADGIDLKPFFELMANKNVMKVFHAARQDLEIIWNLGNLIPEPVFDSQVAAMVCGFGDSISYEQLVQKIANEQLDKSSRFTNWARRPLTDKQLSYALSDVTHLRKIFLFLSASLAEQGREDWVREEMSILTSRETYDLQPKNAWKRLKMRVKKPQELAVLMKVSEWRESEAQSRDLPRNRVLRDETIYQLASQQPRTLDALSQIRSLPNGFARSRHAEGLIKAIEAGATLDRSEMPTLKRGPSLPDGIGATVDLLKVLLKAVSEEEGVAMRVIATVDDLTRIAADDEAPVAALSGWRREIFGLQALKLKRGEVGLKINDGKVKFVVF